MLFVAASACSAEAQTYTVGSDAAAKPQQNSNQTPSGQPLGWGSNIQNARLAHAAEMALQHGDHALAVDYAQRAVQAAPNDPQLWFLLGYAARLDGKLQLAIDSYNHGLRLNPAAIDGLSGLAQSYSIAGRSDDAERLLKQVLASNPRRREDALLLGDLYMRSGDYAGALNYLHRAEEIQPDARSELLLAVSYEHLKQMDQASHYLELARGRAPNNPEVERSLAGYYRETGNYQEAIAALKSIPNPKPDVVAELAYTYQLTGQPDQSATLYKQAANAMPRDMPLQLSAAQAEVAAGSVQDASPFLERASSLDPNYYRLHAIRGEIAQLQEHDEDAVREYTAALAHLPATPVEGPLYGIQLHIDLMELYRSLDDDGAAHQQLATASTEISALNEQGGDRAPFLRLRAVIKMNSDDFNGALDDMKEALAISPHDPNNLQLDGDLLVKLGHTDDAIAVYKQVLAIDSRNRLALTSLGYASRLAGRDQDAEKYFERLAQDYPSLYVPYLALGDMDTAHREFKKAEAFYSKAYALAPHNALIVAGGMNAAIEQHDLDLAGTWLDRATGNMRQQSFVLRETERYFAFKNEYQQSAEAGEKAIKALPRDRDVVVYLGYDLLNLHNYKELLALTDQYNNVLPKEPDIPLLAGYVHKHDGQLEAAQQDFTEALKRDPEVVTAYVNLGYVENDLHEPQSAATNFESALKREPKNGEAHLGLAFSDLDLHKPQPALRQAKLAEDALGDSESIHVIRATAYGREGMLGKSVTEYRAALKFDPNDGALHFGLGNALFAEREYHDAVDELQLAQKYAPANPEITALMARAYASLQDREDTMRYVQLAEQQAQQAEQAPPSRANPGDDANSSSGSELSQIYVSTGEALNTLGDQNAAMERFRMALTAPGSNRISVRLAIAQLMAQQGHSEDAQRQVALGLMESQAGQTDPPTGDQFIEAADVFRSLHEYHLSQTYLERAEAAGASDMSVRIGEANNYLALGDTSRAAGELAAISQSGDSEPNYAYLLAQANVYEQEHQTTQALTAFAQAANDAGEDQTAERAMLQAGANEGYRINPTTSVLSKLIVQGIFEDTTVYVLDSKLDGPTPVPPSDVSLLPPPRSSLETEWTSAYHLHFGNFPIAGGFFQFRNARGEISVPSTSSIQKRDTNDYSFNFGLNPAVHLGDNVITFNSGIQETVRRDSLSPVALNQNLFRVFTYMTTSSFFNAVSVNGYFIHEGGAFTESNLNSHALAGAIDFRVGTPWGKNALVTGWGSNDQVFSPVGIEDYYTASYIGFDRRFSDRLKIEAVAQDLRTWRVVAPRSGIAQALRPAGTINFAPTRNWSLQATTSYSSNRSFHVYDATQNSFSLSYARPFRRKFNVDNGEVSLQYPIRFSAGFQQETFFNFSHGSNQQFRPYISITVF
jgi:tetratricopeptide (TPR) repeat protein